MSNYISPQRKKYFIFFLILSFSLLLVAYLFGETMFPMWQWILLLLGALLLANYHSFWMDIYTRGFKNWREERHRNIDKKQ